MKALILIFTIIYSTFVIAQTEITDDNFRLKVEDVPLSELWSMVLEACPSESEGLRLTHPERRVSLNKSNLTCVALVDLVAELDKGKH